MLKAVKRSIKWVLYLHILVNELLSQSISKIEPANWWNNLDYNHLTLMVYGDSLNLINNVKSESKEIKIINHYKSESKLYYFIDIELDKKIKEGAYRIVLINKNKELFFNFPVYSRSHCENSHRGFSKKDVIYLITPDRFCNGDIDNDSVEGFIEKIDPENPNGRHGGDIQGIINKLPYLKDLGITVIWINPLTENNTRFSYHGYAATDLYKIDARFGNNELYKKLVTEAHKIGIKVILDHVSNHLSIDHPWIKELPFADWLNGTILDHFPAFHDKIVLSDLNSNQNVKNRLLKGWFINEMPDLNQANAVLKKYLIQNALWWIEYSGIDGIREDTYSYNDQNYLSEFNKTILNLYPRFNIVGEVWTGDPAFLAYYQKESSLNKSDTYLPSVTDFALRDNLVRFLKNDGNLYNIYETLCKDYLYPAPENLLTFIDNHDVARVMYEANGDLNKAKLALFMLLTLRGIPQILYGTEIGLKATPEHGYLRQDFPGGFSNSKYNAFSVNGRSDSENEIFNFLRDILTFRQKEDLITEGKFEHYPIIDNLYIYSRSEKNKRLYFLVNGNNSPKEFNINEIIGEKKSVDYKTIYSGSKNDKIKYNKGIINAYSFVILIGE